MNNPSQKTTHVTIVIPCFNEAACLSAMLIELQARLQSARVEVGIEYDVILVDDGSSDSTWKIIEDSSAQCGQLSGIRLRVNAGQQAALLCGYMHAQGAWVLTLDADLQDPPEILVKMLQQTLDGAEIVIGRRRSRNTDTAMKRITAFGFYRIMQIFGVSAKTMQAGDFRLMSRAAVRALIRASNVPLFHRFKIFELGFAISAVEYDRSTRLAGDTKYSYRKMLELAFHATWSSKQARRRLAMICVAVQALSVSLITILALTVFNIGPAIAIGSVQLASLTAFIAPAIYFMWLRLEDGPCFQIAQRCGNLQPAYMEQDISVAPHCSH